MRVGSRLFASVVSAITLSAVLTAVPAAAATPTARDVTDSCAGAPDSGFSDTDNNVHRPMIDCVKHLGVTSGKSSTSYDPNGTLRADQLATFVANTLQAGESPLPAATRDYFTDDNGNLHEDNINRLAEAGVIDTSDMTYGVREIPTRAEMSRLVVNAMVFGEAIDPSREVPDYFTDDTGHPHQRAINQVADLGVVTGKGGGKFGPDETLRRDQMATFLARAADALLDGGAPPEPAPKPADDNDATPTCGSGAETGQLLITGIREDGPGNDVEVRNDSEYVTLTNTSGASVDLSGWKLTDAASNDILIPSGYSIPANGTFAVYSGAGDQKPTSAYFAGRSQAMWNNSGDSATLCDAAGRVSDTYQY